MLQGSPDNWQLPMPPQDQTLNAKPNDPPFSEVDNPRDWPNFCFRVVYDKKGVQKHYQQVTRVVPVPKDRNGNRTINDWTFHYKS